MSPSFDRDWNEFNTFTKLIYPYLEETLGYPPRKSKYFDEQSWVRKRGDTQGPYDGAFKDENGGVVVLIEAKREGKTLTNADVQQAFDYCLGDTFTVPPPYVLVSNGNNNQWFRRNRRTEDDYTYSPVDAVNWEKAQKESGSGELTEQLTLKKMIRILSRTRNLIFSDLAVNYFPESFKLAESALGTRLVGFEKVLKTRESFVDASLAELEEEKAVQHVLSSIALSLTLKVLFIKILTEKSSEAFPAKLKSGIKKRANDFPGILIAAPYDVLEFSDEAEEKIFNMYSSIGVLAALLFQGSDNPIGDVWDGLVESEFDDLQVKSRGNVYTPKAIVNAMVDASERSINGWVGARVLEPACGSGHFVREVYKRIRDSYLSERRVVRTQPAIAHRKALDHLRAIDVDPFAVQTTQLGMFLELYRSSDVWKTLAPNGNFNFSIVVERADYLDDSFFRVFPDFHPTLIIGNPPYGIEVTDSVSARFQISNNDSYGCFVVQSLNILGTSGRLVFVVSNTFLTVRTHQKLRKQIFDKSKIHSVLQLHRNAFPGRDVFCCIIDLEKIEGEANRNYTYRFVDAWPINPLTEEYSKALSVWSRNVSCDDLPETMFREYLTNASLAPLRVQPPHSKDIEGKPLEGIRLLLASQERCLPIHGGVSNLFPFVSDSPFSDYLSEAVGEFPGLGKVDCLEFYRSKEKAPIRIVKLWQICRVFQGLATADDARFIRKTPGIIPNARRRNTLDVNLALAISQERLAALTNDEKENGIEVLDRETTPYYVPFDKGGEQDTEAGEIRAFYSPVDYWIDWSKEAVAELKLRNAYSPGTPKKPRLQNTQYYFRRGIRFTRAGLYAPMFELSFGGVPSDKGSIILPHTEELSYFLLPILCSPITKYLVKNFLQHTVMTEGDVIRQIPIPIPSQAIYIELVNITRQIITAKTNSTDASDLIQNAFGIVSQVFQLEANDISEIETWAKRRYPNLGRSREERQAARSSPTKKAR